MVQSLNFGQGGVSGDKDSDSAKFPRGLLCEKCQIKHDEDKNSPLSNFSCTNCESCFARMKSIANAIKEISAFQCNLSEGEDSNIFSHPIRSNAIDTLIKSYEFSREMKYTSLSALKWLESIGRAKENIPSIAKNRLSVEKDESELSPDAIALRARLNSAQFTISNKQEEINRLNEELSNCRAEIGRLRSASRAQVCPFHCPLI